MANPAIGAALFFTRWITHFCAPVFVFLAGTSAGLMTSRKTPSALGTFLLTRGLWLILVECVVVATAWSFAPWGIEQLGGRVGVAMQVIWVIGASMVVLAGAQFLGQRACLVIGGAIVVGHNLLDPIWPVTNGLFDAAHPVWVALHAQMRTDIGPFSFVWMYPLLPWIGVMLLGFGTAPLFQGPARRGAMRGCSPAAWRRRRHLSCSGRLGVYGEPNPWQVQDRCDRHAHRFPERHEIPAQPALPADDARAGGDCVRVCRSGARSRQAAADRVRPRALRVLCGAPLPPAHARRGIRRPCRASMPVRS